MPNMSGAERRWLDRVGTTGVVCDPSLLSTLSIPPIRVRAIPGAAYVPPDFRAPADVTAPLSSLGPRRAFPRNQL